MYTVISFVSIVGFFGTSVNSLDPGIDRAYSDDKLIEDPIFITLLPMGKSLLVILTKRVK